MNVHPSISQYLRKSKHSETLQVNQLSLTRAENDQPVFKFGFGQSPFPVPEEITVELSNAAYRKEYMSVQGHLPLREAIANFHEEKEGKNKPCSIPPVSITHSTIPIISPPSANLVSNCQPYCAIVARPELPSQSESNPSFTKSAEEPGIKNVTPTLGPANFCILVTSAVCAFIHKKPKPNIIVIINFFIF